MVGLGRMGGNMARRLMRGGHTVVAFDRDPMAIDALAGDGAAGAASLDALVAALPPPRIVWLMVPAGDPTSSMVEQLAERCAPGDIVIDGGNSHYKDDLVRARALAARGIRYVDVGTSGGVWGLERGYSLMIGGDANAVQVLDPIFATLAPGPAGVAPTIGRASNSADRGYLHCGPSGAGHFVKMVHNGIEYGLMQAYAEGFDLLRNADGLHLPDQVRYDFNLADIAEVWRHGSVVGSWLLDLTAMALAEQPHLEGFTGSVPDSGEGRWTIDAAVEAAVPAPVLSAALFARFRSRRDATFGDKLLSAMRAKFGGHTETPRTEQA